MFHRGRLLFQLRRWSEATGDLSSARDLLPSHDETLRLLEQAQEQVQEQAQEKSDAMQLHRNARLAKAERRSQVAAATMLQSSWRGHQARKGIKLSRADLQSKPSSQQLMSEIREGGDIAAGRLRTILDHALDILEPLLLRSPRGDSRKVKRSAVVSAEQLAYETIDGEWCNKFSTCDVDILKSAARHLASLHRLKAGQSSAQDGFSTLSELVDILQQCTSTIQISFAARTPLGLVFNCIPSETGLVRKLSVSKVDPGSQADASKPQVRAGWDVISIGGQQVEQLEPEMALQALKPRPVTIVFSNSNTKLQERQQPKKEQGQGLEVVSKSRSRRTAIQSTMADRGPRVEDSLPHQNSRSDRKATRKADTMATPNKPSSNLSRRKPPLPEFTASKSPRTTFNSTGPVGHQTSKQATSSQSPAQTSATRPAQTPIARKPKRKLLAEDRAKILASDEYKPLKQKLKALSYGARGQDPRKLFSHYDRDNSGELSFSEFNNAVRKGGHVTLAACSDAQLRKLFIAVDEDGSGQVEISELTGFIWGNQNLLSKHGDHDAADHVAPPPEAVAEVTRGALAMPNDTDRERAFDRMDVNGNGKLSLAEVDKAVVEVWPEFNHKKALMRAYRAADLQHDGTISRDEFPLLLKYIVYFDKLWEKFDSMDKDGDHQLNLEEFHQGAEMLGLGKEHGVTWATTVQEFGLMDADGGGAVRFDEFCAWSARKFVSAESSVKTGSSVNRTRPQYDMMYYITVGVDGEEQASEEVTVSHVRSLISNGQITADTNVWAEGMDGGWLPLRDCASEFGLAEALKQRPPPPPPPIHEIEPAEGGARAALMDLVPLFHQTKQYLNKVNSNDRSSPNLSAMDQVSQQPTVLNSRPRGKSWAVPSPQTVPHSTTHARSVASTHARALSSTVSSSSDEDSVLLRRPRGKSWGASHLGHQQQEPEQEREQEQRQQSNIIQRPRGKSWGAPRHDRESQDQEQGEQEQEEQEEQKQRSVIRRPRGKSWGAPRRDQKQDQQTRSIALAAKQNSSDDSDNDAAGGQSTPDFASVADDASTLSVAEFEERWRAMGGSDRVLMQIRQNLRGASYSKGGQDPRKLFQMYDRDNSGDIDRWEFRQAVRKAGRITAAMLNDVDLDRLFDCVDVDGDGDLSIDELIMLIWGDDSGKQKKTQSEALPEYRSQAKRMTEDARFEALREYYLDERITAQRATPPMRTIRSHLAKNDFGVLCGKLQAKYGVHPLAVFNERYVPS